LYLIYFRNMYISLASDEGQELHQGEVTLYWCYDDTTFHIKDSHHISHITIVATLTQLFTTLVTTDTTWNPNPELEPCPQLALIQAQIQNTTPSNTTVSSKPTSFLQQKQHQCHMQPIQILHTRCITTATTDIGLTSDSEGPSLFTHSCCSEKRPKLDRMQIKVFITGGIERWYQILHSLRTILWWTNEICIHFIWVNYFRNSSS